MAIIDVDKLSQNMIRQHKLIMNSTYGAFSGFATAVNYLRIDHGRLRDRDRKRATLWRRLLG